MPSSVQEFRLEPDAKAHTLVLTCLNPSLGGGFVGSCYEGAMRGRVIPVLPKFRPALRVWLFLPGQTYMATGLALPGKEIPVGVNQQRHLNDEKSKNRDNENDRARCERPSVSRGCGGFQLSLSGVQ